MKKTIAAVAAILGLYWISAPGWTSDELDLPFGVTTDEWVAISDDVGLVVEMKPPYPWPTDGPKPHQRAEAVLMAKVKGEWTVIDWPVVDPTGYEFKPLDK